MRAADAAPHGSREAQGLAVLVQRSLPAIETVIDHALAVAPEATRPVLLTDVAPLARYVCKGTYALTVPFMKLMFSLAKPGEPAGWVDQITGNSFMKGEFGTKLIEDYLPRIDLRLVADTSGAYIPGRCTPTVIIVGPQSEVGGIHGPCHPRDPWRTRAT